MSLVAHDVTWSSGTGRSSETITAASATNGL
jgi:hypothetical protein